MTTTEARISERGAQFTELLTDLDSRYVVDVRGRGLMLAVELDSRERRDALMEACLKRGLLTLGCGHATVRLLPPLDATEREVELGASILEAALDDPSLARARTVRDTEDVL